MAKADSKKVRKPSSTAARPASAKRTQGGAGGKKAGSKPTRTASSPAKKAPAKKTAARKVPASKGAPTKAAPKKQASAKRPAAKASGSGKRAESGSRRPTKTAAVGKVARKETPAAKPAPRSTGKSASKPLAKSNSAGATPRKPVPTKADRGTAARAGSPAQPGHSASPAVKPEAAKPKPSTRGPLPFAVNDYVVYPTHGVGRITSISDQEISGMRLELFVIEFDKDKMVLRVPVSKAATSGMRKLSSPEKMTTALTTLKGRARIKRTMWSRRAQEYEAKINSGDPVSIAEVIRDLHRSSNQPDQSYSERQIYEAALERLARELAAVERIDETAAAQRLEDLLRAA
jgi:CarD family transcriptional regulator